MIGETAAHHFESVFLLPFGVFCGGMDAVWLDDGDAEVEGSLSTRADGLSNWQSRVLTKLL